LTLKARIVDPGSDDLFGRWSWADGGQTLVTHLLKAGSADEDPSPQVAPRDVLETRSHSWKDACLYRDVRFDATDDDAGAGFDSTTVLVTGTTNKSRDADWWRREAEKARPALNCTLDAAAHLSAVFAEARDASTSPAAAAVLAEAAATERDRLDRQLLTAWLNVADGSLRYPDVAATLAAAEAARLTGAADDVLKSHRTALAVLNRDKDDD
jgi:hypothetical protein